MSKILLVDLDDVLDDLLPAWTKRINEKFGTNVDPNNITQWKLTKFFPGISQKQMTDLLISPEFWESVPPRKGAVKTVKKLKEEGYVIFVLTSSYYKTLKPKLERFLFKCFPFHWDDVIVTSHKWLVNGDVIIDDNFSNLIDSKVKLKILLTTPPNRYLDDEKLHSKGVVRADDWDEVYNLIHRMKE